MRMRQLLAMLSILIAAATASTATGYEADDAAAESRIKSVMGETWDRPEQPLQVSPVVIVADHAIAGWTQGDMGGRALLRRNGHVWRIVLCSGDQLKLADTLTKIGLPADSSKVLAARLAEAESKVAPARLAQFSKFEGLVMMDAAGHHPPQHSPQHK